jgi:hypothetical protein
VKEVEISCLVSIELEHRWQLIHFDFPEDVGNKLLAVNEFPRVRIAQEETESIKLE